MKTQSPSPHSNPSLAQPTFSIPISDKNSHPIPKRRRSGRERQAPIDTDMAMSIGAYQHYHESMTMFIGTYRDGNDNFDRSHTIMNEN